MITLYYAFNRGMDEMSSIGVMEQVREQVSSEVKKRGRPRKQVGSAIETNLNLKENLREEKKMKDISETKRIQMTVFDLDKFDDVKLLKDVKLPPRPETLKEAMEVVFLNNTDELLRVLYDGMISEATVKARDDLSGFKYSDDNNEPGDDYTGRFASEDQGRKINAAVLSLAKVMGYDQSMTPDQKNALKSQAREFMRSNPAMLKSL